MLEKKEIRYCFIYICVCVIAMNLEVFLAWRPKCLSRLNFSDSMVGKYLRIFGNWFIWVYLRDIDV